MKKGYVGSYTRQKLTRFVATDPKVIIDAKLEKAKKALKQIRIIEEVVFT